MRMTPNHSRRKRLGNVVANAMSSVIDTIREMGLEMMKKPRLSSSLIKATTSS